MPVILQPHHFDSWLNPANNQLADLRDLLRPFPDEILIACPVSRTVNATRTDSPDLIEPV